MLQHRAQCTMKAMAGGFWALLDDITVYAKLAASAAARSGTKAAGVVIDDAAVTPAYVHNLAAARELPIIGKIAARSLRNKALILLPLCLLLGMLDSRVIAALLLTGALYLSYEAAVKIVGGHHHGPKTISEEAVVRQATRTDFVLSAEIMVIALNEVLDRPLLLQAFSLLLVACGMTTLVYGAVALLVKGDDVGLALAGSRTPLVAKAGRGMVRGTLGALKALSVVGVAAMCWVGGHILLEQMAKFSISWPYDSVHNVAHKAHEIPLLAWVIETSLYAGAGLLVGSIIRLGLTLIRPLPKRTGHASATPANTHNETRSGTLSDTQK